MWCGTLCHLSFANLSNFLEIRAIPDCLGIQRSSTVYLDFARRTQRCDPCRHPRSRKILDFDRNYHFTIFHKIRIFRGFTQRPCCVPWNCGVKTEQTITLVTPDQLYRYYPLRAQRALHGFKMCLLGLYLYSVRNFLP